MIDRREIIDAATRFGLNPHIIEKDWVLGWVLAGIYAQSELSDGWVFKGGTCLKKCYFETYRFSEDLDFTLTNEADIDAAHLKRVFARVGDWVYERSGIEVPPDGQDFDIYKNPRGGVSCEGKLTYRGPISPRTGSPRLKLDLTADERLVLKPARVPIFHPYSDAPLEGITVLAYAYEEAFGEKTRALAERTRPRDLYDVVNLFRNESARPLPGVLMDVLRQKCAFKGIGVPRLADLGAHKADLQGGWQTMLAHQLPSLPPLDALWDELPGFFAWLEGGDAPATPPAYARAAGETVVRDRVLNLPVARGALSALESIRFAASNRLCVDLEYQGTTRRIEAYSLRRTAESNLVLHAINVDKGEHRSYRVDRIQGARVTNQSFSPRYEIELTPQASAFVTPAASRSIAPRWAAAPAPSRSTRGSPFGRPSFVFQCPSCGKKFSKKTMDATLGAHKAKGGYPCMGRYGSYVETKP